MMFVTFGEPHGAGHYLWHVEDADYPTYPSGGCAGMPHPIRDVYVAVDHAIGEILDAADDRTTVIVTSGDGMGPNYSGCHLMPDDAQSHGPVLRASGQRDDGAAPRPGRAC